MAELGVARLVVGPVVGEVPWVAPLVGVEALSPSPPSPTPSKSTATDKIPHDLPEIRVDSWRELEAYYQYSQPVRVV